MIERASWTIALRLWGWAAALRVLKWMVPLETLVRLMHRRPNRQRSKLFELRLQRYLETPGAFPFRPPGNCLERSLGVYRLLCGVDAAPELVVGFRQSAGRRMEGHVWVLVDGTAVAEPSDTVGTYTRVVTFDSAARRRGSAGSDALLTDIRFG